VVGQPGHQRDVARLLAQRRLHDLPERRIIEAVYGRQREEMEAMLGVQKLKEELAELPDADEILHVDLTGRDPDEGFTNVP
jgi:hypothetical protein